VHVNSVMVACVAGVLWGGGGGSGGRLALWQNWYILFKCIKSYAQVWLNYKKFSDHHILLSYLRFLHHSIHLVRAQLSLCEYSLYTRAYTCCCFTHVQYTAS
jgi:hypothetical protein